MCGRFVSSSPPDELARYFGAAAPDDLVAPADSQAREAGPRGAGDDRPVANYNVAPTDEVYVVYEDGGPRRLDRLRWGLVPSWAKDLAAGSRMINARAEGIASKGAFKRTFARRRCIVPADGFYEWAKVPGQRKKQPYFVHRPDGEPFAFAGLWEVWRDRAALERGEDAPWVRTCTIITTDANEVLAPLHDRMPVVLAPSAWDAWLDPENADVGRLEGLLVPAPPELVTLHPVSTAVNDVRQSGPELVEPVEPVGPPDPSGRGSGDDGQLSLLDDLEPGRAGRAGGGRRAGRGPGAGG